MSQRIPDGVVFDNSVYIIDEKKEAFPISTRIFQYLAIVIGGWSTVSVMMESLVIPAKPGYINLAVLIIAAIAFALCLFPSYDIIKQFFGALFYLLFLYSRFPRLKNAFYILENLVIKQLSAYYGLQTSKFKADYSTATRDTTLLLIMILIPIVALFAVAIVRSRYVNLTSLILFLPVSASFVIGIIPSERYLVAYIFSMLYLTKSGHSYHSIDKRQKNLLHRINSRAAIWLTMLCFLLFLTMKLFVPKQAYDGIGEIKEIKTQVQTQLFDFSLEDTWKDFTDFRFPGGNSGSGGLSGGELGNTGQVKYTNSEQLLLKAPYDSVAEGMYLKGYVGTVYTGDEWKEHSKETEDLYKKLIQRLPVKEFDPINQIGLLMKSISTTGMADASGSLNYDFSLFKYSYGRMSMEYKDANKKYIYAPYFTDYALLNGIKYQDDLYPAPARRKDNYEFNYYFNLDQGDITGLFGWNNVVEKMGDYSENEKVYREFVHPAYTELPKEGLERLKEDFSVSNINLDTDSLTAKINYVKDYLHNNTQYSLSPGKLPKGKDYVEYFLYENKVGYCAHYASAATLMLRSLGVPARYVEGYAVSSMDIVGGLHDTSQDIRSHTGYGEVTSYQSEVEVSVKDYNAHAWVEVYFDYCGWIPVEFTPGSVVDYSSSVMEDIAAVGDNLSRDEDKEVALPTQAPVNPTPTPITPEETEPGQEKEQETKPEVSGADKKQMISVELVFFLILCSIPFVTLLIFVLVKLQYRNKSFNEKDYNKKALFLFKEAEKILSIWHGLPKKGGLQDNEDYVKHYCFYIDRKEFTKFMEIVKRARFGHGKLSREDVRAAEKFYLSLYEKVYSDLNKWRRMYLKLILFFV